MSVQILFRYKPMNLVKMAAFNNKNPILRNQEIRKALTYAINREYIQTRILQHTAYIADGPLSHESKLHNSGLKNYKYNPKKAIQILYNNGWDDINNDGILDKNKSPFKISIIYQKGVMLDEQMVRRIKFDWNKLGIDVIREPLLKNEINQRIANRRYDVVLMNYQFDETIKSFEDFFKSTGSKNILGYSSKLIDNYFRRYYLVAPASRVEIFKQGIQNIINKDQPAAFLFFLWLDRYFVNRIKFKGFQTKDGKLKPFNEWILNN